jgi:phosphoenolpyruvate-protein kinase (PTS system EI component)
MIRLQTIPFAPGVARGVVTPSTTGIPNRISLVRPSDLEGLSGRPAGLIVIDGAPLSHPMIRILGLGVPTVIVSEAQARELPSDHPLWIDGSSGLVCDSEDLMSQPGRPAETRPHGPYRMADGTEIALNASVASIDDAARAKSLGANAIGLVRSEGLLLEEPLPPDADWFRTRFDRLVRAAAPLPVTVRLIDFAADKRPSWLGEIAGSSGPIGLQGSRLYGEPAVRRILEAELEGLAALTEPGVAEVLVPYLVFPEDFIGIRRRVAAVLGKDIAIGAMIETPGAAFDIAQWLEIADFVSIGCNDLMQCLFAADRDIPELTSWLDPHAPGLFRFLRYMLSQAEDEVTRVRLCGLLPQMPSVLPILIGLGGRRFTAAPGVIPYLADAAAHTNLGDAQGLAERVCSAASAREVRSQLGLPAMPAWERRDLAAD